jgi:hypothetical protein
MIEPKPRGRAPQGGKSTRVVYLGEDCYEVLLQEAILISHSTKKQVTPQILARHLVHNISDESRQKEIKELTSPNKQEPRRDASQSGKNQVYLGVDGYELLLQEAILLSHRTKKQVTPAILARHLVLSISGENREQLIKEFTTTNAE